MADENLPDDSVRGSGKTVWSYVFNKTIGRVVELGAQGRNLKSHHPRSAPSWAELPKAELEPKV